MMPYSEFKSPKSMKFQKLEEIEGLKAQLFEELVETVDARIRESVVNQQ